MQKTGTILSCTPTQQGGYQSQGGWVFTYNITLQCPDGPITGEIGAKSQPYPVANGQEITVTVTPGEHGNKLKKINPQYANQGGQTSGGQSSGGAQSRPNKDRLIVAQVVFKEMCSRAIDEVNEGNITNYVDMIMRVGSGQPTPAATSASNDNPAPNRAETDDIPF